MIGNSSRGIGLEKCCDRSRKEKGRVLAGRSGSVNLACPVAIRVERGGETKAIKLLVVVRLIFVIGRPRQLLLRWASTFVLFCFRSSCLSFFLHWERGGGGRILLRVDQVTSAIVNGRSLLVRQVERRKAREIKKETQLKDSIILVVPSLLLYIDPDIGPVKLRDADGSRRVVFCLFAQCFSSFPLPVYQFLYRMNTSSERLE